MCNYFLTETNGDAVLEDETEATCNELNIDELPFYCKLIILSKLDTQDICNLSMTSRHWREVCNDQYLWRELLYRDMLKWHSIGHKSFPLVSLNDFCDLLCDYGDNSKTDDESETPNMPLPAYDLHARLSCNKNTHFKALYFHSAYQRHKDFQLIGVVSCPDADKEYDDCEEKLPTSPTDQQLASNQSFQRFLRSLWMKMRSGDGEVIMLGPGMESPNTKKIFKRLLWARPDLLMTQRLLPGSQDGVGSGVELEFKGEKRFNLIALYSGNERERRKRIGIERLIHSNIIEQVEELENKQSHEAGESSAACTRTQKQCIKFKLRELVFNFLQQRVGTYRLIYVVDATRGQHLSQLACNQYELQALLDGIRSFENEALENFEQTKAEQRNAGADNGTSAFSSIIHFTGMSSSSGGPPRKPLLVLSCIKNRESDRIPCVEVASLLDLAAIGDRPWLVQDVTVDNLNGLESGLEWLFKQG